MIIAHHVKESLFKDFVNKSEFSDWFHREEIAPRKIVKKPNPRNVELQTDIIAAEARLKLFVIPKTRFELKMLTYHI